MMKQVLFLSIIFIVVAVLSLILLPALIFFLVIGIALCLYAKIAKPKNSNWLFKLGAVFSIAPTITFTLVTLGMSGAFY